MGYTEGTEHGTAETAPAPEHPADGGREQMPTSKRTTSPAFQFYPEAWLSSSKVRRMSYTERGMYADLLAYCWLDNGLPTDIKLIASMLGVPLRRFQKIWSNGALRECFSERAGRLHNARLDRERNKQAEFRRRQSDNGARGGRPRKNPLETQTKPTGFEIETQTKARALEIEIRDRDRDQDPVLEERNDIAFIAFQNAYPPSRRKGGYLTANLFFEAVNTGRTKVDDIMAALANHKASEQWSDPKLIPGMDVWLREERWRQRLEPKGTTQANLAKVPAWAR